MTLEAIKKEKSLLKMDLVRIGRLSVGKVTPEEFEKICAMGETKI